MAELKIQNDDNASVPGQKSARGAHSKPSENRLFKDRSKKDEFGPDYTYRKIRLHKGDEVNIYAAEQDERYGVDPRLKKIIICAIACILVLILACILPTQLFYRAQFSMAAWLDELVAGARNLIGAFADPNSMYASYALTVVVTMFAGAAMALSGGIFQGSLKNALASPTTLGVTSGGTIGAILYAVFLYPHMQTALYNGSYSDLAEIYNSMSPLEWFLEYFGSFFCSLLGCALIVTLIMLIALIAGRGKVSNVALIVAGQVFTSLIALILNYVRAWLINHGDTDVAIYVANAQTLTFQGAYTPISVLIFLVPLIICMAICFIMARRMSLLAFNDDEARSMGISPTRTRNLVVAICTIMTALVVSFCGPVGFVGFLVPHIARKLIGPDFKYLLPACALIGGLMVTVVFYITQIGIPFIPTGSTGVVTSIVGCVAFIIIALRGRRSSGGEWL